MALDIDERLRQCFAVIFPSVPPGQIATASTDTVEAWDSIQHIRLVNVIEEEFNAVIDPEEAGELVSFQQFADYLRTRVN